MFYDNSICDGCGEKLHEDDDVVVCPVCGTPQHKSCYEINNRCVNEHLHESGFVWESPVTEEPASHPDEQQEHTEKKPLPRIRGDFGSPMSGPVDFPAQMVGTGPDFYNRTGYNTNDEFDGVKMQDAAAFIQISVRRYLRRFARSDGKKFFVSWNWAAFFFAPMWFFYRKLYKIGFVFLAFIVAMNLILFPQIEKISDSYESIEAVRTEYMDALTAATENPTEENNTALAQAQEKINKVMEGITPIITRITFLTFILPNFIAALIANCVYKRRLLENIKAAYKSAGGQDVIKYSILINGGVAIFPATAALIAELYLPDLILSIVNYFILK